MTYRPHSQGRSAAAFGRCLALLAPSLLLSCGQPNKDDSPEKQKPSKGDSEASKKPDSSPEGPKPSPETTEESNSSDAGENSETDGGAIFDLGSPPENTTPSDQDDCDCEEHADLIYLWGGQGLANCSITSSPPTW